MNEFLTQLQAIDAAHKHAADFQKSLSLLRALKAGRVSLAEVTMTDDGWSVTAASPAVLPPDLDARRNGILQPEGEPAPAE